MCAEWHRLQPVIWPLRKVSRSVISHLLARNKAITYPRVSQDVARLRRIGLNLFSQVTDEDAQVFSLIRVISTPNLCEQRTVSQDLAGVANQEREQIKLLGREPDFFAGNLHRTRFKVHAEISRF